MKTVRIGWIVVLTAVLWTGAESLSVIFGVSRFCPTVVIALSILTMWLLLMRYREPYVRRVNVEYFHAHQLLCAMDFDMIKNAVGAKLDAVRIRQPCVNKSDDVQKSDTEECLLAKLGPITRKFFESIGSDAIQVDSIYFSQDTFAVVEADITNEKCLKIGTNGLDIAYLVPYGRDTVFEIDSSVYEENDGFVVYPNIYYALYKLLCSETSR